MKKIREKKNDPGRLFCPSYQASVADLNQQTITAKKFIKIMMAVLDEIERFANTAEFKDQIALAMTSLENSATVQIEFVREIKVCTLKKQLDELFKKLHLNEKLDQEALEQLKQKIVFLYDTTIQGSAINQNNILQKELTLIVSNILHNANYYLTNQVDLSQPPKHKKLMVS